MNKFLLIAINSKYVHSNLAVYCLKAATKYSDNVTIKEFTINNRLDEIIKGIYLEKPDAIGISCYIWNIDFVKMIIPELHKLMPHMDIWLGGPEVTYNSYYYLENFPYISGVMKGEGEYIFASLMDCYMENRLENIPDIKGIHGIFNGRIFNNECPAPIDMSENPMPYYKAGFTEADYKNKIIYYESQRGCPFSCSYCLSSVDKRLRFRKLSMVLEDLKMFLDMKVALVKFVDRTFNCKREHSRTIWKFLRDNDNGITSFHFEIAADLIEDEDIEILNSLRPGQIQLEIGVQSTNPRTIEAIHRTMNLDKLRSNVKAIHLKGNIHMHLDLIAGLPYEDFESFRKSFNDIYSMEPDNLQLGFLKLLYGSLMREEADKYGIVASDYPMYEVLFTKYISYDEILKLKVLENVLEMYYNSGFFAGSVKYLVKFFESPFDMYMKLGEFFEEKYPDGALPSKNGKFELLHDFAAKILDKKSLFLFTELLRYDMFLHDNVKNYPVCFAISEENIVKARSYITDHKMTKAEHVEIFALNPETFVSTGELFENQTVIYFDYLHRQFNNNVTTKVLEEIR